MERTSPAKIEFGTPDPFPPAAFPAGSRLSQPALRCLAAWGLAAVFVAVGCGQVMEDQPRYEPLEASTFFDNGMSSRGLVAGTVARGHLRIDEAFYTGRLNGQLVETFPQDTVAEKLNLPGDNDAEVTRGILLRGQQRYEIFCAVCHDRVGTGDGMVVQRGFPRPPSYHIERLQNVPVSHFYDVITNGIGRMYDYSEQISPADRWAIAAYIRALQLSQNAPLEDLSDEDRGQLEGGRP
jgi:mono/diheme cytochrome c family protein